MADSRRKLTALLLSALAVGQEAKLRNEKAQVVLSSHHVAGGAQGVLRAGGAEKDWEAVNEKCTWDWWTFDCVGADTSVTCDRAYLPLDVSLSAPCRVTDEYMLGQREKFVDMQGNLLKAKAAKFESKCRSLRSLFTGWESLRCARRLGHIARAMKFLAKANVTEAEVQIGPEIKAAAKLFDHAATALGAALDNQTQDFFKQFS